ncbi:hypothetical protein M378DRAFT_154756, partial [Amanita muscaria Koide BX008]
IAVASESAWMECSKLDRECKDSRELAPPGAISTCYKRPSRHHTIVVFVGRLSLTDGRRLFV